MSVDPDHELVASPGVPVAVDLAVAEGHLATNVV